MTSLICLHSLGNLLAFPFILQFDSIMDTVSVLVVAGVVVVLVPTLTTLGAVWSRRGN
jgi:hypothetical protein